MKVSKNDAALDDTISEDWLLFFLPLCLSSSCFPLTNRFTDRGHSLQIEKIVTTGFSLQLLTSTLVRANALSIRKDEQLFIELCITSYIRLYSIRLNPVHISNLTVNYTKTRDTMCGHLWLYLYLRLVHRLGELLNHRLLRNQEGFFDRRGLLSL